MSAFESKKMINVNLTEYEIIESCSIQQLIKKLVLYVLKFWEIKGG